MSAVEFPPQFFQALYEVIEDLQNFAVDPGPMLEVIARVNSVRYTSVREAVDAAYRLEADLEKMVCSSGVGFYDTRIPGIFRECFHRMDPVGTVSSGRVLQPILPRPISPAPGYEAACSSAAYEDLTGKRGRPLFSERRPPTPAIPPLSLDGPILPCPSPLRAPLPGGLSSVDLLMKLEAGNLDGVILWCRNVTEQLSLARDRSRATAPPKINGAMYEILVRNVSQCFIDLLALDQQVKGGAFGEQAASSSSASSSAAYHHFDAAPAADPQAPVARSTTHGMDDFEMGLEEPLVTPLDEQEGREGEEERGEAAACSEKGKENMAPPDSGAS